MDYVATRENSFAAPVLAYTAQARNGTAANIINAWGEFT
jgi:hypothetical protein